MQYLHPIRRMAYVALAMWCLSYGSSAHAAPLDLSDLPLFLTSSKVPANLLFLIDDSGSMDWEVMTTDANNDGIFSNTQPDGTDPADGSAGTVKHRDDNDDGIADCAFARNGQTFNGYIYDIEMPNNSYGGGGGQNCNIADDRAWRFRNSDFNPLYFDPKRTYKPWVGYDDKGALMTDMPITAAKEDPFESGSPTVDLTTQNSKRGLSDHNNDGRPDGFRYYTWTDLDGDGYFDNGEETEHLIQDADAETQQNFANWFSYYRSREYVTKAAFGKILAGLSTDFRAGVITVQNNAGSNLAIDQVNQDVATGHKRALLDSLYKIRSSGGTPLRSALAQGGYYFVCKGGGGLGFSDCPILTAEEGGSCQQNFLVLMTDGFYDDSYAKTGNTDGPNNGNTKWDGGAYADNWSDTVADIAMDYYERDLHSELDDDVPTIIGVDEAKHQHIVTYSIAFGVNGSLDANPLNLTDTFAWPDPKSSSAAKIDDLRHAAFNGRGEFLNATKPDQLVKTLQTAIDSIEERTTSAASVALNSGSYNEGSQLYQARFVVGAWSGNLTAFPLDENGLVQAAAWDTGQLLDTQDWDQGRRILTYDNATKQGIPFRWADFGPGMQELLHHDAYDVRDGKGEARTEFLRGNRDRDGVDFRRRRQVLGDLIDSNPIFVGAPVFPNEIGAGYADFRVAHQDRQHMLYIGGNDGMLHGFSATNGEERLAYIPGAVFDGLSQLTDPYYRHRFYVDGSPTVADVYGNFGTNRCGTTSVCWRSVLASGLRKGGQAIFSLDVTDPAQFSESRAKNQVLWEFTDADDPDLGYTYGMPSIVKMSGDRWAVIFGNGYNNTEPDGHASSTGKAALFILFFDKSFDGYWIRNHNYVKISVGVSDPTTPNGLASPAAIDIDGDFDTEYIYAGDLRGNLWKFDVHNLDFLTWSAVPLFAATSDDGRAQAITSQPEVGKHPDGGVMIYFGTGKYIEKSDQMTDGAQVQTFYGIRDKLEVPTALVSRGTLFPQTIQDNGVTRITTTEITYDDCTTQYNGWYVNLPTPGERQVTDSILRNQRIIFTTMIPNTVPCSFGGDSWIMEFDAICGNRLKDSPFDLNDDQEFTDADKVGDPPMAVTGIKSTEGIAPRPSILFNKGAGEPDEYKYISGSAGGIQRTVENPGDNTRGRMAWQQFK
jgi:type IV pilus assembly protein PilY1